MKRAIFIFLIAIGGINFLSAQTSTAVLKEIVVQCDQVTTVDASNSIKNYLTTSYPARFTSYIADLGAHTAKITCDMEPVDVLQIYRQLGYEGIYLDQENHKKFNLSPDGTYAKIIKE